MENLDSVFIGKQLADLKPIVNTGVKTFTLEPTKEEIQAMVELMRNGKSDKEIKVGYRRTVGTGKQGFSYDQIKEIRQAWNQKIEELTPKKELNV